MAQITKSTNRSAKPSYEAGIQPGKGTSRNMIRTLKFAVVVILQLAPLTEDR